MIIKPNQKFLHGRKAFEKGKLYGVPDGMGEYFIRNGWAEAATGKAEIVLLEALGIDAPRAPATLTVDNVKIGVK